MTTTTKILRLIEQSPATAGEVGAILFPKLSLYESRRLASAHLCNLRTRGKLKVIGKVPRDEYQGTRIMSNLYSMKTKTVDITVATK